MPVEQVMWRVGDTPVRLKDSSLDSEQTFGGSDLTGIYVITADGWDKAVEGTGAGELFRLNLGIKGM